MNADTYNLKMAYVPSQFLVESYYFSNYFQRIGIVSLMWRWVIECQSLLIIHHLFFVFLRRQMSCCSILWMVFQSNLSIGLWQNLFRPHYRHGFPQLPRLLRPVEKSLI